MSIVKRSIQYLIILLSMYSILISHSLACTAISLKATNGAVVYGRTMEFNTPTKSKIIIVPRHTSYTGTTPLGVKTGVRWKTKYGFTGANIFNYPQIVDGVNEKGLVVGVLYFPDYAKYEKFTNKTAKQSLAPWELGTYILSKFSTVDEVKKGLKSIKVVSVSLPEFGFSPPLHYIVVDASGKRIVIENLKGKVKIYDNPVGVLTNSPSFSWHMTNLRNYINLTVNNVPPVKLSGITLQQIGQGSGLHGIPGDFTPPSRFVRAVVFSNYSVPFNTAEQGVFQVFHILNLFDIPKGAVVDISGNKKSFDITQWTSSVDLKNRRYYFHTYGNREIRMVDLNAVNLNGDKVIFIPMSNKPAVKNLMNSTLRPSPKN